MENWNFRMQAWTASFAVPGFYTIRALASMIPARLTSANSAATRRRGGCNSDRETRAGSVRGGLSRRRASRELLLRLRLFWYQYSTAIGGETVMGARRGHVDGERL